MSSYAGLFGPGGSDGSASVPVSYRGFPSASFSLNLIGDYTGLVTPDDGGAGGIFQPPTLAYSGFSDPQFFTYAAPHTGSIVISASGSPSLTIFGSPISLTVYAAPYQDPISAVQAWWLTQTGLQQLVTGGALWHLEAPEDAAVEPYATFFLVSMAPRDWTTGYAIWQAVIQINIHHSLPASAAYLAQAFADALNSIRVTELPQIFVQGTQAMSVFPESFGIELGEGLGTQGRDCWVAHFTVSLPWTS